MSVVASSLSVNLNQLLQKKVQINDVQYDYCCKFLAVGCRSQNGPEIMILEKGGQSNSPASLNSVNTINCTCDPILLFWAPPQFGRILVVVLNDNSVVFYQGAATGATGKFSVYHQKKDVLSSISCMSVGVSPCGELLCAVGSPNGNVAVIFAGGSFECVNFQANYGGVSSVAFMDNEGNADGGCEGGKCVLATGGIDGCVKIWQLNNRSFQLVSTLNLKSESKCLMQVRCLAWSKNGRLLAAATLAEVFVFEHVMEGKEAQRIGLPKASCKATVAFNNDRLVVCCESETLVYCRDESGGYHLSNTLEE
ncbi:hypothetical protein BgAZ_109350 [Babesia gibsoni]|uniref:Uncharacterized protein n=1 Tax=Babesia gibsoni TaxID=33632 RepID=A0AAD8PGP4_BABGI|nr:hypothetical protein BgAZ_109320 [Babesia gibsoni]KAK1445029.1 hypothetical protein BgAZ_109350 [Babesia gibsoni]